MQEPHIKKRTADGAKRMVRESVEKGWKEGALSTPMATQGVPGDHTFRYMQISLMFQFEVQSKIKSWAIRWVA